MEEILRMETIQDYNRFLGAETLHPLVSFLDLSTLKTIRHRRKYFGFYCVYLKLLDCGTILYGRSRYDYQEGTMLFVGPGQVHGINDGGETPNPRGLALMFHPDLLYGTPLARRIQDFNFFSYTSNEALHTSEKERAVIVGCMEEIGRELQHPIDKHTKQIVASYLETLLNYCERFYDRQFITRELPNRDILARFEQLLHDYFDSDLPKRLGLPTVKYCADRVFLSPNYFGDLIKSETGKSAQDYIQDRIVGKIKERLTEDHQLSISEIAYGLGFKYPHHLNRLFKKSTGMTPLQYRQNAS